MGVSDPNSGGAGQNWVSNPRNHLLFWLNNLNDQSRQFVPRTLLSLDIEDDRKKFLERLLATSEQEVSLQESQISSLKQDLTEALLSLLLLAAYFPHRTVMDFGAGCGLVRFVFDLRRKEVELENVISLDNITFSKDSFDALNPEASHAYIYGEIIYDLNSKIYDGNVILMRWVFDEMDKSSKLKFLSNLEHTRAEGFVIQGSKHDNLFDIDSELLKAGFVLEAIMGPPINHGLTRVYRRSRHGERKTLFMKIALSIYKLCVRLRVNPQSRARLLKKLFS